MLKQIISRITQTIIVVFILVCGAFFAVSELPGSPFSGEKEVDPYVMKKLEETYGFDKSKPEQLFLFWKNLFTNGSLGKSTNFKNRNVTEIIAHSFPISLQLGLAAMLLAVLIGFPMGIIAAIYKNQWQDYLTMIFAMGGICLPAFVIGPLLQVAVARNSSFFNVAGWFEAQDVFLPALTLGFAVAAYIARLMRGGMLDVLNQDYIRTARAKGVSAKNIILQHALRPSIAPTVTYLGTAFAAVITGSFVVEMIFQIPGMGQHFVNAVLAKDIFLVLGLVLFYGLIVGVVNLAVDIALILLNPRLRS